MRKVGIRVLGIAVLALTFAACSSIVTSADLDCPKVPLSSIDGEYENLGTTKLNGRPIYLTQILWRQAKDFSIKTHASIDRVEVARSPDGTLVATGFSGAKQVRSEPFNPDLKIVDDEIEVFRNFRVIPSAAGDLHVGPQTLRVKLILDCKHNLVVNWRHDQAGLALLTIPVSATTERDSVFMRVNSPRRDPSARLGSEDA